MAVRKKRKFPLGIGDTLLSEERFRLLDPQNVMDVFSVRSGSVLLDVGCGPGAFLEAASTRVGPDGLVHAIDIQEPFVGMARRLASEKGLINIKFTVSREDRIPLEDETADTAIMITTLHELEGNSTLTEVSRILKSNGLLGIVEWQKEKTPVGPPVSERISEQETEDLLKANGFDVEKVFSIGLYHYGITGRKSG